MRTNLLCAVIHVLNAEQAVRNARVAFENGSDGIFLINHDRILSEELILVYNLVRRDFPQRWIGLNFLGLTASQAISRLPVSANALWLDDALVKEGLEAASLTRDIWALTRERRPRFEALLFGGVAFKYVHESSDPARDAVVAAPYIDVVTTSGPATGTAPDLEKIRSMREALDQAAKNRLQKNTDLLAVASGMTPENVDPFLEYVDYFLVATGISTDFHNLDPARVRRMSDKMHR